MKKTILTLAMVVAVGFGGMNLAEARWGGGGFMMGGSGGGPGYCNGPKGQGVETVEEYEELEKFHADTADLRKQIFEKKQEYREVMNQESPDKEQAKEIWSQLFDLKEAMHQKADAAGIEPRKGRRNRF